MKALVFIIILLGCLLAIDAYVFQAVRTIVQNSSGQHKTIYYSLYWLLTILTLIVFISAVLTDPRSWSNIIKTITITGVVSLFIAKMIVTGFLLFDDVIRIGKWALLKFNTADAEAGADAISRSEFLSRAGMLLAGVPILTLFYGVVKNAYNYRVHNIKVRLENLPEAFHGMKIVQISDIHSGSFSEKEPIKAAVETINAAEADVIFFTGDLVNSKAEEMLDYIDIFKNLKAKHGVYSIMGNHDYGDYFQWPNKEAMNANNEQFLNIHKSLGWKLLRDQNEILPGVDGDLAIVGVENWSAKGHFGQRGNLKKALEGTENAAVKLLLSHDPSHWDAQIRTDFPEVDITFSGHTHGAQFGVENKFLKWSPSQYFYEQWAGLYKKGRQFLYVNRGFGFIGYPGRVGILPEITVMQLEKA